MSSSAPTVETAASALASAEAAALQPAVAAGGGAAPADAARAVDAVTRIYDTHADFVWRSLRRLGVSDASSDDALQDVFVVVHRRFADYDPARPVKTWLYGIAVRVARDYRRAVRRKGGLASYDDAPGGEGLADHAPGPHERAAKAEGLRILDGVLDTLDDDRREVFVLAEIEQLTAPEIAEVLGVNANTVYSRLRAARIEFDAAVARLRRRQSP